MRKPSQAVAKSLAYSSGALLAVAALQVMAGPDPKLWRPAPEFKLHCETDTVRPVRYQTRPGIPSGTQLSGADFYPAGYTTGDMVASCKVLQRDTEAVVLEFNRVPVSWVEDDRSFHFVQEDLLFRLVGGPLSEELTVFKKIPQAARPAAQQRRASQPAKK